MIQFAKQQQQKLNAKHVDMPAEEYHAHPAIGSSMIEEFRNSRRMYKLRYVDKVAKAKPVSAVMLFGTLVHLLLLEPEKVAQIVANPYPELAPDGKKWLRRKGSDHEKWWQDEIDKRKGKIAVSKEDRKRADRVVQAIMANRHARRLLERDGKPEYSIFWIDPATGLECKCRIDWWSSIPLDIKTTGLVAPQDYARQLVNLGYHRKLAHYLAGISALLDEKDPPFVHLAAESDEPFRVACYEIDDRDANGYRLGVDQRRRTLAEIAECVESGDWREPWERQVCTLQLPRYAWTESEYSF